MKNKITLTHCIILEGNENMEPKENMSIVIEDGLISYIGENPNTKDSEIIDLYDKYVLPGLINAHVHLPGSGKPSKPGSQNADSVKKLIGNPIAYSVIKRMCANYAKTELLSGTTTIRTMGGLGQIDSSIRDSVNNGEKIGPRMLVSDMAVSVPGGHMAGVLAYEATSPEECRTYVSKIAEGKPDIIKLMITGGVLDAKVKGEPGILKMPLEYVEAACAEAHKLGFKVAAHTESTEGVLVALKGGVDTIEHGAMPTDEIIALYKERKAADICTISPALPIATFPTELTNSTELVQYNGKVVMDGIIESAKECLANDIPVGLGTDTACPFVTHYNMWRELYLFHKYVGVSTSFALYSATLGNAKILGIEKETGSVTEGKSADLFIADCNPLDDLSILAKPYMVVFKGKIMKNPKVKKYAKIEKNLDVAFAKL
ncbi:MAG: amidohydrolase family protein [Peptostreptococcaceae bacterium]|nr:amidohydrolase family protein [Peptostreptococcaceae bacterium]